MDTRKKAGLLQALYGSIVLALLMQPLFIMGYGGHVWLIFMPLVLFFASGVKFELLPSMIVCYFVGILWAMFDGVVAGLLSFLPEPVMGLIAPIILVFLILTIHENFLSGTILGNVPALFLGLAEAFFVRSITPANAPEIGVLHLGGFFLYGVVLTLALVIGGGILCKKVFGIDMSQPPEEMEVEA